MDLTIQSQRNLLKKDYRFGQSPKGEPSSEVSRVGRSVTASGDSGVRARRRTYWASKIQSLNFEGVMEVSLLKVLLSHISSFFQLSSCDNIRSEPVLKYYQNTEEILKLLKPILDAVLNSETPSEEAANKLFEELCYSVGELKELFQKWQSLSSKLYFVLLSDTLISRIQKISLDLFQFLQASHEDLFVESNSSLEQCVQKIRFVRHEQSSTVFKDALRDQVEGVAPSSEVLAKIAVCLNLRSNQEVLIEAVALEKLKENAEQAEKTGEVEYIEQMIALVTCMHERLLTMKQSENYSPVSIPPDFCCPLSLDLMTDPVIVSSGQTYERAFIKDWIDLGLTVCPKTRQTLAHTNLIPNYTVKALIANWCESNNVKLPDPLKSVSANHPSPLLGSRNSVVQRDSPVFPYNRNYPPMSPESTRSEGSPANILSSPGRNLPQPDNSLPSVPVDVLGLDTERVSHTTSEDSVDTLEDDNLVIQASITPLRTDYHGASGAELPQSHSRTSSLSNAVSDFPREVSEDAVASLVSTMTGGTTDASAEVKVEPLKPDALTNTLQRESDQFPPKLMETRSRSHNLWRRPSERFIPRIVSSSSSSIETRPDLSGVEAQVEKLAEDLKNPSLETIRAAAAEIRLLAKHNMDNRIVIAKCGVITLLVDLLTSTDPEIQDHAVTALLNLSINDNNKTIIAQAKAIEPLIQVLQTGSPEAKENSAATLFSLSVIEENKIKIGRSGAIVPLVDLLGNGTPRGKKDAATALFNLSIFHENKARIVQAGAVKHLVELMDPAAGMVDKAVAVLANLATIPEGRTAIGQEGGIPVLVEVVELGSARGKENAAAALLQLCTSSNRFCSQVLQEGAVPPLVALSQSGTPRAREKAQTLLRYFRNHRHGGAGRG